MEDWKLSKVKIELIKYCSLTFFPQKKSGNLRGLVGTSNGPVFRRERDLTLAWRRQSEHRKSGTDYSAPSRVLKCRSRSVAKSLYCYILQTAVSQDEGRK